MSKPKPKALDLFCGAGGAALGMIEAGYEVWGIDINPKHENIYPGHFTCGDALQPDFDLAEFHFIWASPPCQAYSIARRMQPKTKKEFPNLIEPTRELLDGNRFTCIENVPGAPLHTNLILTAPMFGLDRIYRKRHFELSFDLLWRIEQPEIKKMKPGTLKSGRGIVVTKSLSCSDHFYPRKAIGLPGTVPPKEACEAMGINLPMKRAQVGEAIPPAFSKYISEAAL